MKCKYCNNKVHWFWYIFVFVRECDACETGISHFEQGRSNYDPRVHKQGKIIK